MKDMPFKLKLYTSFIIGLGLCYLGLAISDIDYTIIPDIVFFSILGMIAEGLNIRIKGSTAISVNFAIGLAAMLLFRPGTAAFIGFASMLFFIEYVDGKFIHLFNSSIYKRIFNGSAYAMSLGTAGMVYDLVKNSYSSFTFMNFNALGIILGIVIYTFQNILIFSILSSILEGRKFWEFFKDNAWLAVNIVGLFPLGIIIAAAYANYGWFAVLLFFGPLLIARYSFKLYMDMRHVYFETIKALSSAMEAKDQYTNGHSYRVADYAAGIAEQMGFKHDAIDRIKTAAVLHDIGKIGVSDNILNKPGKLEESEYAMIQKHPEIGAKILSEVEFLADVSKIIKYHHERFDGKGYPEGLKDAEIPMEASILAVADAYDAMTSDRPYRKAMDRHTAMNILIKESGIQFNPIVVKAFRDYLGKQGEAMAHVG
ncbi:putative nucleotidyltransferase with HDIG domain [Anaerosolibacter carboniphilus]|uniref:Putative nucleotidyltransferase with HDIG domain n=1 Tax=Anaerosolibacter carboniphilus TaxID=1417629 RepID=A0A841KW31_9FIRM|nr:HD-GYP domain-containing protein [Anaerosolibacter carboniphilus]MBB6216448.1 putative nucleotidyltransferase with HDIG domain [Anaerosolibacter carboniphilus]